MLGCLALIFLACKKDEKPTEDRKVSYTYGKYKETDAIVTAERNGEYLSISLGSALTQNNGGIVIQIENYKGIGVYPFSEKVIVRADQDNQEGYWEHFYYDNSGKVYAAGEINIKTLSDDKIVASVNGKLYHLTGQLEIINTELKASLDSYL